MGQDVIILSGGMDSVTLLHDLHSQGVELHALSFNYGQKLSKELDCARRQCERLGVHHQVIDISFMKELTSNISSLTSDTIAVPKVKDVLGSAQPNSYVPNRNMILLSIAAAYCENIGGSSTYYGAQQHDAYSGYWDTTVQFVQAINSVLCQNRTKYMEIVAPFVNMKKQDVLQIGLKLDVDYSDTWTCYNGRLAACGTCPTCADRLMAFARVGVPDPLNYEINIPWADLIAQHKIS